PSDRFSAINSSSLPTRTHSNVLGPFKELLCAVILSRPISCRLGHCTICKILNPPYKFRKPVAIEPAGPKEFLEILETAQTQHRGKTAEEITFLADAIKNTIYIKGLGNTGLNISCRRVQWQWDEAYPLIDARTQTALENLGLPQHAKRVQKIIEVRRKELGSEEDSEGNVDKQRNRAFVFLFERAVGRTWLGGLEMC
ncbi:hypothetical protein BDU57DRAFT_453911, partial [Ampelomyces quisqualis]